MTNQAKGIKENKQSIKTKAKQDNWQAVQSYGRKERKMNLMKGIVKAKPKERWAKRSAEPKGKQRKLIRKIP